MRPAVAPAGIAGCHAGFAPGHRPGATAVLGSMTGEALDNQERAVASAVRLLHDADRAVPLAQLAHVIGELTLRARASYGTDAA